jgi:hypothetical protein
MNKLPSPLRLSRSGAVLSEMLIGSGLTALLAAGMLIGIVTIHRSFQAAQHHVKSQVEQARLLNYISRDLRRALTVKVDTFEGSQRITMSIPDFYTIDPATGREVPREPVIRGGGVDYGDPSNPVSISYYKSGSVIYRSVDGQPSPLATDVNDFEPTYTDSGKQIVGVSVSFVPKFQLSATNVSGLRAGTSTYATTLLRNKRL